MLIVISPSKKLDFDKNITVNDYSIPTLLNYSTELIEKLRECSINELTKLMNISYGLAEQNLERFLMWKIPFTLNNSKPAVYAFNGEVYTGLNPSDFTNEEIKTAQQKLRILSGLYGVIRPLDLIQPYRLEMGTKLNTSKGKNLYEYWGNIITEEINKEIIKNKCKHLVNLCSNEYFKAIKEININAKIITPVFKQQTNGVYRVLSFYAKKARGLMTRYIIKNNIENVEHIKAFDIEGYSFSPQQSNSQQWVFLR